MNTQAPSPASRRWSGLALSALWGLSWALGSPAQASAPPEKVVCTNAPRHTWLTEAQARAAFNASAYMLVRFKVSRGNCHEFYAIDPLGAVVETYQHPVTGEAVRTTRIPPPPPPRSLPLPPALTCGGFRRSWHRNGARSCRPSVA